MWKLPIVLIMVALFSCSDSYARPVRMAALPALTPDGSTLVFDWEDDLWVVASTGGVARALTRNEALDRMPVISPDGKEVAFMSNRDGNFQTYVMSIAGGEPRQVTFHSEGSAPQSWYPDGTHLLVRGSRDGGEFLPQRFLTVDTHERQAEQMLFDDSGDNGRWSPDGGRLLFVRDGVNIYRKNYRGSEVSTIWLFDAKTGGYEEVASAEGDCRSPLWRPDGKGFYFVNDATGCANLWEKDLKSGRAKQRTFFKDFPVITPCISRDGSTVVFRQWVDFYAWKPGLDVPPVIVPIDAPVDETANAVRRLTLERVENQVGSGTTAFAADGKQLAFSSGGRIWFMDTQVKDPIVMVEESTAYDTSPVWLPGEKALYFIRDTGERANVWKAKRADEKLPWWQNRKFLLEQVTDDQQGRVSLSIDPTGKCLAWNCRPGELWVSDISGSNIHRILQSPAEVGYDWSPDGRYIVASVQDSDDNRDIWIYAVDGSHAPYNLSCHPNWDGMATWSPDGKCIAYVGRTYDNEVDIYYAWLRLADHGKMEKEVKRAKAGKKDDAEKKEDKDDEKKSEKKEGHSDSNAVPAAVHIDFEGLAERVQRVRDVGVGAGNLFWSGDSKALAFHSTVGGKSGTWKLFFPNPGKPEFMCAAMGTEAWWTKKLELLWVVDGVPATLETRHSFVVYSERDAVAWRTLGFRIMWRALRDEFYDPKMNNLDWAAIRLKYEKFIPQVDNAGFARLIHMLNGELNASHMDFVPAEKNTGWGGDWKLVTGHPGVMFDPLSPGPGLRVSEVIVHSPADRDITRITTNDTVLSIDGVEIGPRFDLTRVLNGAMPREVLLVVTNAAGRRDVLLPLSTSKQVRDWRRDGDVRVARDRVAKWSGGRFGYIDIEKMQMDDLRQFEKEVYAEGFGHDGLVIDVRNNTGGYISDRLLNILCHPRHAITVPRGGEFSYQGNYIDHAFWMKPIVVLCNKHTTSNGEIFAQAIKTLHRGKLVGTATGCAVISTSDRQILDLGKFRIPHRGWFNTETGLDMEIKGVEPDITVPECPGDRVAGRDEPLKRAVEVLADEMKHQPKAAVLRRASEVRAGEK